MASTDLRKSEAARERARLRFTTYGRKRTPEYGIWCRMLTRCHNENSARYSYYGARGITVCPRWRESFQCFIDDMGPRPSSKHSIERQDNSRGYEPDNCVWATRSEQRRNRRDVKRFAYRGEMLTLSEISERCGINLYTLQNRINVLGWDIGRATTQPKRKFVRSSKELAKDREPITSDML